MDKGSKNNIGRYRKSLISKNYLKKKNRYLDKIKKNNLNVILYGNRNDDIYIMPYFVYDFIKRDMLQEKYNNKFKCKTTE